MRGYKNQKKSFKVSFLLMTILPVIIMGILIAVVSGIAFKRLVEEEVRDNMTDIAYVISNTMDKLYPGDYSLAKSDKYIALQKGGEFVTVNEYLENIKEDTRMEITLFHGDVRMITTLTDTEGNSMEGTTVNYTTRKTVIEGDRPAFYSSVIAGSKEYYAYYLPLHNSDGSVVGMIAVLKHADNVKLHIKQSVYPVFFIVIIITAFAGFISAVYSQKIINCFESIKKYLLSIKKDRNLEPLDGKLLARQDELGEMANAAVDMQRSIKMLTESDTLTGIYNRRYAGKKLESIVDDSRNTGINFAVAIADIDFFKNVNDTYGHEAGDTVLVFISNLIKKFMHGRGFVARWGGEEFIIVFDKSDICQAEAELENLRIKIMDSAILYNNNEIKITMSFGVANGTNGNLNDIIRCADERLYAAKNGGRNCVVGDIERNN